ncbi:MAG: Rpn family recombination-promoting nuclease/putative transposase, partial [Acidobacteriota bacterium]
MKQRAHPKASGQTPLAEYELANPHDVFFKKLIGRRATAIQFLKLYLPAEVTAPFDWRALERVEDTFISEELREHFSDLIFRIRLKDGSPIYVYILLEHKSAPERWVALQVLGYIVALWQQMKEGGAQELPLVIPVVFYHGIRVENVRTDLA